MTCVGKSYIYRNMIGNKSIEAWLSGIGHRIF
jgi:hypothetical protein